MPIRHLISLADLDPETLTELVGRSVHFAGGGAAGYKPLAERIVGVYFAVTSTRTRTSFTVGALKLGAQVIAYGPNDLQLATGETLEDTARVLSGYLDLLVIRNNTAQEEMRTLARQQRMAVINAMSRQEHPTQGLADLSVLQEAFGKLKGLHVLYLGEGNNTAVALALAAGQLPGLRVTLITPEGYGLPAEAVDEAQRLAGGRAEIEHHHRMDRLPAEVDAVYTTRWQTMGVAHQDPDWRQRFAPYAVTQEVMARVSRPGGGTVFLHDLPAMRGEEVADEVLDGAQSLAWRQAEHKMFSAMAALEWCAGTEPQG